MMLQLAVMGDDDFLKRDQREEGQGAIDHGPADY